MRRTILLLAVLSWFALPELARAQGAVYLSNLGETTSGSVPVAGDAWIAASFFTGNAPGGYVVDAVQLLMAGALGNPGNIRVSIYSSTLFRAPDASLGSLAGIDPGGSGSFMFSTSGLFLPPDKLHFVVVTSSSPLMLGQYNWSIANTNSYTGIEQWRTMQATWGSTDGLSWFRNDDPFQFAISANRAPEPASPTLIVLGLAVAGFWRCRHMQKPRRLTSC